MRLRSFLAATAVTSITILPFANPTLAEEQAPEEMISEGAGLIINAIELMLLSIPTYEAPEVLPNGDIIIRRVKPGETPTENDDLEAPGEQL